MRPDRAPGTGTGSTDAPGIREVVPRPALLARVGVARVTVVSAPAGSGKTVLLRSWAGQAGVGDRAARVEARRDEGGPAQFWIDAAGALRRTAAGAGLVRGLTAAPDLDGWTVVEQLLADLAPLRERLWLVIDDVHELAADQALRQLELLVMRAPPALSFVLSARPDVPLGLHRLRLEGELAEIRAADLRFSRAEARELLAAAGTELSEHSAGLLYERTEGWAAGLRLAALSLAGHPDPERLAAEFSGTERTVADYLLAEVLDRQGDDVRRLLLRTSILERVNGELADLLTGDGGGERVLQDLERANAFVASVDLGRTWFRCHPLFADLLRLELRRTAPREVAGLHQAAARWLGEHGLPAEGIRHAQAARDWALAGRLAAEHWPDLYLDGEGATVLELLARFPPGIRAADGELATVAVVAELAHGSAEAAGQYLRLAEQAGARNPRAQLLLGIARMLMARQRADRATEAEQARRLAAAAGAGLAVRPGLADDLRALALTGLDVTAIAAGEAAAHLEQGIALARRAGRPYLEFTGLAHLAAAAMFRSRAQAAECGSQAIELAERHGWADEHTAGVACLALGITLTWQGRLEEAQPWVRRAERSVRADTHPMAGIAVCFSRAVLELGRGRDAAALDACRAAGRLAAAGSAPGPLLTGIRGLALQALVRLGETEQVEQALGHAPARGEVQAALAALRLAQGSPSAAAAALAPVLDGSAPLAWPAWLVQALVLEAMAQDLLGNEDAADQALERALDLAEPDGALLCFLLHPAPALLERRARRRTAHAALIAEILGLLAARGLATPPDDAQPPAEPLSDSELRVLRYLPTNLTVPEIADVLYVSRNTVKTHTRNLYAKLGTHRRAETVARARDLGLLAPPARA